MNENYLIKINLSEGVLEVSGSDKQWVAEKLIEFKELLNSSITPKTPSKREALNNKADTSVKRKASAPKGRSQKNDELEARFDKEVKEKLASYVSERQVAFDASLPAQAAIIATFLADELSLDGVDHNDTYTVYSVMGWKAPGNSRSQLNNAMTRNQYFGSIKNGKSILSHKGENFSRFESVNKAK